MKTIKILAGVIFITILYIALGIIPIPYHPAKNYYEKSQKVKQGMTLNKVLKIMGDQPDYIYDYDERTVSDSHSRLCIIYRGPILSGEEIRILFNDYLLVADVSVSD